MDVAFQRAQELFGNENFTVVAQDCDFVPDERMIKWYTRSGDGPIHLASYVYCPGFGGVTIFRDDQYKAMDGWMSDPTHVVLAPSGGERFKDLGKAEDKAR